MQSRCVLVSEDQHFTVNVVSSAEIQPSHNSTECNQPFEGSLELLDWPTTQRFFQEIKIGRFIDSTPEKQSDQNHVPESKTESQPTEIAMKRELEDISAPKSAKKRKNSKMSSCSSSSLNLENLPKEKQCFRVSDFCWGILNQDKDKAESDQRLSWIDREKLIFKIQSKYKEDVARLWGLKKGNTNACYFNLARSIRWAKVNNQDFEDVTDQDQVGVWLVYKFGPRFRNRMSDFLPSHNNGQNNDVFINDEKTTSSLNNQSTTGEEFFEQLIDTSSFERIMNELKNDGINRDWFNDIPNDVNQSTASRKDEN